MWSTIPQALTWLALALFVVWSFVWIWRDMTWRERPTWLRALVVALLFPTLIGMAIWMEDRRRHPPPAERDRWAIALRRFGDAVRARLRR